MLAAVVCATFCGFRGLQPTVQGLNRHGVAMWHLLGFLRKPPCRQTFANVLAELDADLLEQVLLAFVEQLDVPAGEDSSCSSSKTSSAELDVDVWDGKTLRGTRKGDRRAEQVLVRMQSALGKVLSRRAIPETTNESRTARELVRNLVLKGKLVVADAASCQREGGQAMVDSGGDYLVTVKGNQPHLLRDVEQAFVISKGFFPPPCMKNWNRVRRRVPRRKTGAVLKSER